MPPRRHRSTSNAHAASLQNVPPPTQRTQTPSSATQRQLGMLPAVYQSNMKVLLRREPSITAIIDQFSHVCLYHHNGQKWEKHGYEGSMFLYEKSTYPTYGFYILNRMGTDDYVRPIYPEDDMEIIGDYLMYRFYPDYTRTRLEMGLPYPIPQEHRATFDAELLRRIPPEEQQKDREKKGRSIILGLWMFATDAREPLKEVMMRLHSYLKRNLPYPDEFKYGPGRPPPPNPHLRTASRSSIHTPAQDQGDAPQVSQTTGITSSQTLPSVSVEHATAATNASGSELDKLFAKLIPPSASAPLPTAPSAGPTTAITLNDLFAAAASVNGAGTQSGPPAQPQPAPEPTPEPVSRGQALLNSIFASVTPSASATNLMNAGSHHSQSEEITIVSPKPTSTALPQILNQDVISTLLGLSPDSRASSAAPSSVSSRRSNQRRYEGDNEYSEGGERISDGVPSRSHTVDAETNGQMTGIPTFSVHHTTSSESEAEDSGSSRRVPGDVTPRPPAGGMRLPPASPSHATTPSASLSAPNLNGRSNGASDSGAPSTPRERTLVPFEANSELWPYPRAPLDDRSFDNDDIVELDFNDTRALSDPAIFSSRLKEKQKKKGKRSKKEREEDRERERAEIEKGWDMPARGQGQPSQPSSAATSAPVAAPAQAANDAQNAVQSKKATANGVANGTPAAPHANGHSPNGVLNTSAAKDALLSAMSTKGVASGQTIARNDFVRELLTLIHTDSKFVDGLWQDYLARTA
ncbi:hypothetical protein BV20DRAFT_970836 [Pilatotrama ljubarskyi]|nr:hypothetical protein BV20DRAFT_970836 [Pilatotrama ljubarskyi]